MDDFESCQVHIPPGGLLIWGGLCRNYRHLCLGARGKAVRNGFVFGGAGKLAFKSLKRFTGRFLCITPLPFQVWVVYLTMGFPFETVPFFCVVCDTSRAGVRILTIFEKMKKQSLWVEVCSAPQNQRFRARGVAKIGIWTPARVFLITKKALSPSVRRIFCLSAPISSTK